MGYYLRFLSEDDRPLVLDEILSGLRKIDPRFQLADGGMLIRGNERLAQLDVSTVADGLFEEEIRELREEAGQGSATTGAVITRLGSVTAILAAGVLLQARTTDQTFDLLSPLWDWLTANRRGLIHADGEGFYEGRELILATG
jgi:hypothetical protein